MSRAHRSPGEVKPNAAGSSLAALATATGIPMFVLKFARIEPSSSPASAIETVRSRAGERAWLAAENAPSDAAREITLLTALRTAPGGQTSVRPSPPSEPPLHGVGAGATALPNLSSKMAEIARRDGIASADLAVCAAANMPARRAPVTLSLKAIERAKRNGIDPDLLAAATAANL